MVNERRTHRSYASFDESKERKKIWNEKRHNTANNVSFEWRKQGTAINHLEQIGEREKKMKKTYE